ncbi:MAG: Fe(2+)-trafficking protein [Phycisphaerae bacterium]
MAERLIHCAKLNADLPAIDESTRDGQMALKMCLLFGGRELQQRVRDNISAKAWAMWSDHMRMVLNEYRMDATSDQANEVLRQHMEAFFFADQMQVPNYVPPKSG